MGSQKVSMAEFEDFPKTQRKHYAPPDNLGPGLAPKAEEKLPVTLNRSRIAHDGADMYTENNTAVSTAAREQSSGDAPMMSSYQAMLSGDSLEQKKKTGKKCMGPQGASGAAQGTLFFGSASMGSKPDHPGALMMGTTKESPHIPGYCGHIPKTASQADPPPARSHDKSLVIENFKPYGAGYTGRKG